MVVYNQINGSRLHSLMIWARKHGIEVGQWEKKIKTNVRKRTRRCGKKNGGNEKAKTMFGSKKYQGR